MDIMKSKKKYPMTLSSLIFINWWRKNVPSNYEDLYKIAISHRKK